MSGAKKGVAVNISSRESRAVYTHCYGHALNLAVSDSVKGSKVMRDSLDSVYEMSKLIKYSQRRDTKLEELKTEMNPDKPGFHVLCPTRWTVRAASLCSVLDNYSVLQSLWEICYEFVKDSETHARIVGVQSQMFSFDFLFGVSLGYELQHKDMSAAEGQRLAELTVTTLSNLRQEESYDKFWADVTKKLDHLEVNEPSLPRRRKMPARFDTGNAPCEYQETVKYLYRLKYYEALDLAINCIRDRFAQPGYKISRHLEDMLLKCVTEDPIYSNDMDCVVDFYKDDIDKTTLHTQLDCFKVLIKQSVDNVNTLTISQIVDVIRERKPASRTMFCDIVTVLKLISVMPATNAISERSLSALRRVKTYLRSSMTQERLNHVMLLHVHRDATDNMDLGQVANTFTSCKESRLANFGKF
ncbi:zinc finger MYM-type protein 1-like [Gigantopelta aegis]|uniref:zinc finger MYM-type protein 1-like n=1 Tax=Gigantopelta aegis TaxID=1735272 RepID=UPI001B8877EC|nr:zinc finger MYM-type protein 1-like [Gigantopelta aegis]